MLSTETAFGHIIPKYAIPHVDAEMVEQCVVRVVETVKSAFFDWKGTRGADKGRLTTILDEIGVPIKSLIFPMKQSLLF